MIVLRLIKLKRKMKFIPCMFLAILLLVTSTASKANTHTEYYIRLVFVETPLSIFKGSIPISQKTAMTRNHYRFTYDSLNRLVSVAFFNGKVAKDPDDSGNRFFFSSSVQISYASKKEVLRFFNRKNNPVNVWGQVAQFVFELDENGFRKDLYFLNTRREKVENSWKIYRYTWKTDTTN